MNKPKTNELPALVYGLRGIQELFGVGKNTAQTYKNTWLKPAVSQIGKKIIVNVSQALELYSAESLRVYVEQHNGDIGIKP
jgi:hypothetical protein